MATIVPQRNVAVSSVRRRKSNWTPYLFILPHLIFFMVFIGYPFFNGIYLSLLQYNYLRPDLTQFVGIQNYVNLFTPGTPQYQAFWNALFNTIEFVIYSVPPLV